MASLIACSSPPPEDYAGRFAKERAAKDDYLRTAAESPIEPGDRDKFLPLSYFPIDESVAVPAQLVPDQQRMRIQVQTSTGTFEEVERIGTLQFNLKGQPLRLIAFAERGSPRLFVPFGDATNGLETYKSGRYLNLDPTATGIYVIDFNGAYQPYCYYNPEFVCPLPPAENRLSVPIRAGERMRDADIKAAP